MIFMLFSTLVFIKLSFKANQLDLEITIRFYSTFLRKIRRSYHNSEQLQPILNQQKSFERNLTKFLLKTGTFSF